MNNLTAEETDNLMSEIGMRLANEAVGHPVENDDIDDILVKALGEASEEQRYEVVDNMIDFFAVAEVVKQATSDGSSLDQEELEELTGFLNELETDTKAVIVDLVA